MSNEIFDKLRVETGRLTFKDVRYMLIRPDTVVDFQKAVEALVGPERCAKAMMAGGYTGGSRSSKRYKEVFNYTDEEIVAFMCKMGGEIGWGRFSLVELDAASKRLAIEVEGSPFAEAYMRDQPTTSPLPVCHMIRGVLAGMAAGIFGGDVASEETACVAKGDPVCRFVIRG
ncbi:MAG: V4R domain-containing protein [Anaerolineae bacterium]